MTNKKPALRLRNTGLPNDLALQLVQRIEQMVPSAKTDYLRDQILSKYVSPETAPPEVRRNAAIRKWLATERENEATNVRLLLTPEEYNILPRVSYGDFVGWCRALTREIIGDTPPVEALIGSFSGGASTSRSRISSQPSSKYLGKAHATPRCLELFSTLVEEMPGWLGEDGLLEYQEVVGNVMFTVPKKTDIDRVACKEPDLNMFIQKGIGNYFRNSLRRIGINLNDQSRNRSLARSGSLTGDLSTLDLSSASDSVTEGLVALFLPEIWYTHLDAVRCHVTVIDGEEHRNEMFSSMGNGFTFELESLLFYVLSRATAYFTGTSGVVSVYGDDIICPRAMAESLIWVLSYFGFSTNEEKSCISGPLRESCGGHYWNGVDITPFYIKEPISKIEDVIHVANQLRKWSQIEGLGILDPEAEEIWLWLKSFIPNVLWGGGDTAFKYQLVSYDTAQYRLLESTTKKCAGLGGYFHWLNATWDRTNFYEAVETSSYSKTKAGMLRLKKVRQPTVPRLPALYLSEVRAASEICGAQPHKSA